MPHRLVLAATLLLGGAAAMCQTQLAPCYDWILAEKLRGGYLSCADLGPGLAQAQAVGMNCLLPKFGGLQAPPTEANIKLLRDWGIAGREHGLHILPVFNFRGGDTERILSDRREVTAGGETMKLTPCPLDEEFWTLYILGRAVWLAEHAAELGLDGAVLDPEMYGADHTGFGGACYCDWCLREFLQASGEPVPDPLPAARERVAWLQANQLSARYDQRFLDRVQELSRRVERECHDLNPEFLLGVLLLDYPIPFHQGLAMGMGTPERPVLGFSESTYSSGYTDYVDKQPGVFAAMPANALFVPGLWQQQFPSEHLAEQYYTCAARSAGYWIYTFESLLEDVSKLPGYQLPEPHERYWEAMKTANAELDKLLASDGAYQSPLKVRAFDPPLPMVTTGDIAIEALMPSPDASPLSLGPITRPRLRYRNPLFILAQAGETVRARVTNLQLANYRPGTQWVVVAPDGGRLLEGHLKVTQSCEVSFTPDRDGVYLLVAESGQNSHSIEVLTGQANAFAATQRQRLVVNGALGRLYFHVPQGVAQFSVFAKAEGQAAGRGGKLTVFGPDGQPAAHIEGDLGSWTQMQMAVPAQAQGRVWCLAAEDVTNDLNVYFSPEVSPYLSPDPARVLSVRP